MRKKNYSSKRKSPALQWLSFKHNELLMKQWLNLKQKEALMMDWMSNAAGKGINFRLILNS